jgi:hypothetical protein
VADGYIAADQHRLAGITMQHCAILHIAAGPHLDGA